MKFLPSSACLALLLSVLPVLSGADTKAKSAAPAKSGQAAAKTTIAGEYAGSWKAQNDTGGSLRINLKAGEGATWNAEVWFTFEGTEVPTKVKSVKIEDGKIELVIGWEVQGTAAQSTLKGEQKGDVLSGKYDSTSQEGAAAGTWTVTRR